MDNELYAVAESMGRALKTRGATLTTAESCTGGWIGEVITMVSGSSDWYGYGFITYSNAAKRKVLNVSKETLEKHGAVSEATVLEMVDGALKVSGADFAVAVSGIAGPTGGSAQKPVGTVCIAWGAPEGARIAKTFRFDGDRAQVRRSSVIAALRTVIELAEKPMTA